MRLWILLGIIIGFSWSGVSQVPLNYDLLHYMASKEPDPDPDDKEQIKKQFQTYFVKEVFLNNVFKSSHLYYSDENANDYGLVNQLMINQFAEQLVDTNFLDLSHLSIDE